MGYARKAGSGNGRWAQFFRARDKVVNDKGTTVPGISTRGNHRSPSGSNKSGALTQGNLEWGAASRKLEDHQRGINHRARNQHVAEGLADYEGEMMEDHYPPEWEPEETPEQALVDSGVMFNGRFIESLDEEPLTYHERLAAARVENSALRQRVSDLEQLVAHADRRLADVLTTVERMQNRIDSMVIHFGSGRTDDSTQPGDHSPGGAGR